VDRAEWRALADRWVADAKALLDARRWSAAYYAAGYAVECGLKACLLTRLAANPGLMFEDRRFSDRCWTHNLRDLLRLAGLEADEAAANAGCRRNSAVVFDWSEQARYQTATHHQAKKLFNAISNRTNGVFSWVKARW
jgi:HEPN domain-containing protein